MIEKMKFLSITGPKSDIDRVVNQYLSKYEIHLENAMAQLSQIQHLSPYIQINPYKDLLSRVNEFAGLLKNPKDVPVGDISLEEIQALVDYSWQPNFQNQWNMRKISPRNALL